MSLGVFHWSKDNRSGAEASIESFKKHCPGIPYFLVCDGGVSYADLCAKHDVEYYHSNTTLGYPSSNGRGDWGYGADQVEIFLTRILMACHALKTTHLVISEDDVICLNPIQYHTNWELASYWVTDGNILNPQLLRHAHAMSGVEPNHIHYGAGAGSIIKTSTFIKYFPAFQSFLKNDFEYFHRNCNYQLGWNDCFITMFFYLAGKEYVENPRLHNIWPENPDTNLNELAQHYDMVHNYKNYYENRKGTYVTYKTN